jgi:predicted HNH restriction endonuclease
VDVSAEWPSVAGVLGIPGVLEAGPRDQRDELIVLLEAVTRLPLSGDEEDELHDVLARVALTAHRDAVGTFDLDVAQARFAELFAGAEPDPESDVDAVWVEFADHREALRGVADGIRANLENPEAESATPDVLDITEAVEGRILTAVHVRRERSRRLRAAKIAAVGDSPTCEVCGFDFSATYGERGEGFIECHHLQAVSELRPGETTALEDLALVCANCHRMIHARQPWLTPTQLREIVQRN